MKKRHPLLFAFLSLIVLTVIIFIASYALTIWTGNWSLIPGNKIALVRIEGVILDSREIIEELKEYNSNESVKAILLRIDSPGGAVAHSQEIYEEGKKNKIGRAA